MNIYKCPETAKNLSNIPPNSIGVIVCDNPGFLTIKGIERAKRVEWIEIVNCNVFYCDICLSKYPLGNITIFKISCCLQVTSLDLNGLPQLEKLEAPCNNIREVQFKDNKKLQFIDLSDNEVEQIDVGQLALLQVLIVYNNKLKQITFSELNRELKQLDVWSNSLELLDLSKLPQIQFCSCSDNVIKEIKFSNVNKLLQTLLAAHNRVEQIDLSFLQNLQEVDLEHNKLKQFQLSITNTNIHILNLSNNELSEPNLFLQFRFLRNAFQIVLCNNVVANNELTNICLQYSLAQNKLCEVLLTQNNTEQQSEVQFVQQFVQNKQPLQQNKQIIQIQKEDERITRMTNELIKQFPQLQLEFEALDEELQKQKQLEKSGNVEQKVVEEKEKAEGVKRGSVKKQAVKKAQKVQ